MQYRQLRYFVKVVEAGQFFSCGCYDLRGATSLSEQVAELEEEMGHKLLHRTPRGVQPTSAGQVLFERASSILRRLEELPSVLKSSTGQIAGTGNVPTDVEIGGAALLASSL